MTMKKAVALTAVAVALGMLVALALPVSRPSAVAATGGRRTPLVLAALPNIGTIYWRYNCGGQGSSRWSLGLHVSSNAATTGVRFKAGRLIVVRDLQPGDPTSWFPYSGESVQWLAAGAGGEEGTVVGVLRVNYGYPSREPHCFSYAPPRVTVQFFPRRYYRSRDFLRQFTG